MSIHIKGRIPYDSSVTSLYPNAAIPILFTIGNTVKSTNTKDTAVKNCNKRINNNCPDTQAAPRFYYIPDFFT